MTCIIAIKDGSGGVLMGADSAVSGGCEARVMAESKLVRHGEFLIGISGSARTAQVVQHGFTPPKTENPDLGYMVTSFSKALMKAFDAHFIAPVDEHGHGNPFEILVAVRGKIFTVYEDFHVGTYPEPYAAIGCGGPQAMCALEVLQNGGMGPVLDPQSSLQQALAATAKYSAHVLPPFVVERLDPYQAPAKKSKKKAAKRLRR